MQSCATAEVRKVAAPLRVFVTVRLTEAQLGGCPTPQLLISLETNLMAHSLGLHLRAAVY